jgi:hypothetical protein
MDQHGAEQAVMASAIVVAGTWGYRKLVEPTASTAEVSSPVKQLIGLEPTPAPAAKFMVAFGFTYLALSLATMGAPDVAGSMAILIATGSILSNGATLFTDVSGQVATKKATATTAKAPAAKKAA